MAKKKGMNRTAGTARRKMSASERVSYGLKTGAPLTGSASGVKSINLRQAGEALTQGIVSARGKKLSFDPAGLAMALPVGKVAKAAKALSAAGKITQAVALESRIAAKVLGRKNPFRAGLSAAQQDGNAIKALGKRRASESVFPRAVGGTVNPPTLRQEYKTVKAGYEQVFGKGKKVSSFNPDLAAMTMLPGSRGSLAKIRKISNQVDSYLKKRGGKTIGK